MDPKRTAFHDAMELAKQHGGFKRFHLTDNLNWYTVDLDDGIFEVNGLPFSACSQFINASQYDLTLIYAREKHELSGYVPEGTPASYYNRILIGWWFTAPDYIYVVDYETGARKRKYRKGEKVEQTIAIPLT